MADENGNRESRLDRIERALELMISDHELFREEHKQLLTAQVLQRDMIDNLVKRAEANEKRWEEQMARNAGFDSRVDKLVLSIGELVSRIPPASLAPKSAPAKRAAKKAAKKKAGKKGKD